MKVHQNVRRPLSYEQHLHRGLCASGLKGKPLHFLARLVSTFSAINRHEWILDKFVLEASSFNWSLKTGLISYLPDGKTKIEIHSSSQVIYRLTLWGRFEEPCWTWVLFLSDTKIKKYHSGFYAAPMLLAPPNMLPWIDEWLLMYRLGTTEEPYSTPNTAASKQPANSLWGKNKALNGRTDQQRSPQSQ